MVMFYAPCKLNCHPKPLINFYMCLYVFRYGFYNTTVLINSFAGCGYCKKLKPTFALAATELKGEAVSPNNIIYLTNKEARDVYYTVIKHDGHLWEM